MSNCNRCGKPLGGDDDLHTCTPVDDGPSLVKAARQALAALDSNPTMMGEWISDLRDAREALRAALEKERFCDTHCTWLDHADGCERADSAEPVAWMDIDRDGTRLDVRMWSDGNRDEVPLYAASPKRKPLTDEEIIDCWKSVYEPGHREHANAFRMARAIEKAHGIGESDE